MKWLLVVVLVLLSIVFSIRPARAASPTTIPSQGHVTTHDGKPVGGATVWLIRKPLYQKPVVVRKTTTAADGSFDLASLASLQDKDNALKVVVRADGLGLCGAERRFDIEMPAAVTAKVKLQLLDGSGAAGVKIAPRTIFGNSRLEVDQWFASIPEELLGEFAVITDAEGIATIPLLPRDSQVALRTLDDSFAKIPIEDELKIPRTGEPVLAVIRLFPAASIEGRVVDPDGKPVANVAVLARSSSVTVEAYTDEQGLYTIRQMQPGVYNLMLRFSEELADHYTVAATPKFAVGQAQHIKDQDFRLIPGTLITGKVMDADTHQPLAGNFIAVTGPTSSTTRSREDGTYRLRVPAGSHQVQFTHLIPDGYVSVEPTSKDVTTTGKQNATVDFLLRRDTSPPLAGRVVDKAGHPAAGATVLAERAFKSDWILANVVEKTTDDQGRFQFLALPPGSILYAYQAKLGALKPVTVAAGMKDITLTVEEGYRTSITGIVSDAYHQPLASVKVYLSPTRQNLGVVGITTLTDAEGRYEFESLPVDRSYNVSASAKGYGYAKKEISLTPARATEAPPLVLPLADSFVAGQVVDSTGKPLAGVTVRLKTPFSSIRRTDTDADGKFRFDGIVPSEKASVSINSPKGEPVRSDAKPGSSDTILKLPSP